MEHSEIIYFDNAATSFPKPQRVYGKVREAMLYSGGNAGRGAHRLSMAAAREIYDCRCEAARFFGSESPERVIFTMNTTYALNVAIKGMLRSGDRVIISDLEHNAVYRPICALALERGVKYDIFNTYTCADGYTDEKLVDGIRNLIKNDTRMLVCTCSSNICSRSLPIEKIGRLCREKGIIFVVDAAQGAGHCNIDMRKMNIDVLCVPSHKGLYGPQGCGLAIFGDFADCRPLIEGGNGYDSLSAGMGDTMPEKLEAGTLPTQIIAGLREGIVSVAEAGVEQIAAYERALFERAKEMLENTDGVSVYAPEYSGSVISFNLDGIPSEQIAAMLDRRGICVRGGYHCAALAHKTLRTPSSGAVRISFGRFNRMSELEKLWKVLREIKNE